MALEYSKMLLSFPSALPGNNNNNNNNNNKVHRFF
jgi:hypothetical protein